MNRNQIENSLTEWFEDMLKKYIDVSFRYEYNEKRNVYLVSYSINVDECQESAFFKDVMAFEDKMDLLFENDAPLFCEGESLFKLSSDAIIKSNSEFKNQEIFIFNWQNLTDFYYNMNPIGSFLMAA